MDPAILFVSQKAPRKYALVRWPADRKRLADYTHPCLDTVYDAVNIKT